MKITKAFVVMAVVLGLSAMVMNGVAYAQSSAVGQSENTASTFMSSVPDYQQYVSSSAPAAQVNTYEAASGQSIIFNNGVPTTVIGADGTQTAYSESMWDFLDGYNAGGPYGVGISSNPDVPTGGTWKQVTESGTFGTQEPNLIIS